MTEAELDAILRDLHESDPNGGWDPYEVMPVLAALSRCGYRVTKDDEGAES